MPNVLAHLGTGAAASRLFDRQIDPRWVLAGCIIPDVPWILQRAITNLEMEIDPYDLRLYAICQASLFSCLLLSASLALVSRQPHKIFLVLSGNALLHLLLDACQTKWANGVHLLAPFNWHDFNLQLFWPESLLSVGLTIFGLIYSLHVRWRIRWKLVQWKFTEPGFVALSGCLLVSYLLVPYLLMNQAYQSDSHFVKTLHEVQQRPGREIEFDRNRAYQHDNHHKIVTFAGEEIQAQGMSWEGEAIISLRGAFLDQNTLEVQRWHLHPARLRDWASLIGLSLVVLSWIPPRSSQ